MHHVYVCYMNLVPVVKKTRKLQMFLSFLAYIYIRGEFYNEASNLQIAINEVSISHILLPLLYSSEKHCKIILWCLSFFIT